MYNVLFGLASSLANKGSEIKLSLQKYSANDTSDFSQCSNALPWKMERKRVSSYLFKLVFTEETTVDVLENEKKEGGCFLVFSFFFF